MTEKHVHGVYHSIAESYAAVLHLIGSGWRKENIIVIMQHSVPVGIDGNIEERNREMQQKNLLETAFPMRTYTLDYFHELCDNDRDILQPYLKDLEAGHIVLVLCGRHQKG